MGSSSVDANKYPGTCVRCGGRVAAGTGSFRFVRRQAYHASWPDLRGTRCRDESILEHDECRARYDGTGVHHRYNPDPNCLPLDDA